MSNARVRRFVLVFGALMLLGLISAFCIQQEASSRAVASIAVPGIAELTSVQDVPPVQALCDQAELGVGLGFRRADPWARQILCVSDQGIQAIETTVTRTFVSHPRILLPMRPEFRGLLWTSHAQGLFLTEGIQHGCPEDAELLAVIPLQVEQTEGGILIQHGQLLCLQGETILVRGSISPEVDYATIERWGDFVPL